MNAPYSAARFAPAMAAPLPAAKPAAHSPYSPRTFDLHPALHIGTFGGFFAYLGIMWAALGEAPLAIPFAIFAIFLIAAFVVPALWARVAPIPGPKAGWDAFRREGMECETGHLPSGAVIAQVMIMPAMLIVWGLWIAVVRASV